MRKPQKLKPSHLAARRLVSTRSRFFVKKIGLRSALASVARSAFAEFDEFYAATFAARNPLT